MQGTQYAPRESILCMEHFVALQCLYMLHQIKAQQFYTDLGCYQQCYVLQKIVEIKEFSRPLSDIPVLFKANLIFKVFSRKPFKFKYFSSLCEPWSLITGLNGHN